ncbi:MAG: translational GTPase TypA [Phycisphaerales bacterium]
MTTPARTEMRNVAIIAHVDHGKTTLVDQLLKQSGMFRLADLDKLAGGQHNLIMDSNDLERERGITILSKNCAVTYTRENGEKIRINIIDTPGHADFGGEVERVLRMADGCMLLVDAAEGPMPQTRFVLGKAIEAGLKPVVVINKCDRPDARVEGVINEVFDLLVDLGADELALDFPIIYASGKDGWANADEPVMTLDMRPIFEAIVEQVPPATGSNDNPLQMLVTSIDFSEYTGRIGIGRVFEGVIRKGQQVTLVDREGNQRNAKVADLHAFDGLGKVPAESVGAGDLCAVSGIEGIDIGDTLCPAGQPLPLPPVKVDEPTLTMHFRVNDSPFCGREGQYVTARQVRDRLFRELEKNVALRVEPVEGGEEFAVSGRGLLHLGVLIETMRREGYELAVGMANVITKEIGGVVHEPVERLVVEAPEEVMGSAMELIMNRKGIMIHMDHREGRQHCVFEIPSRGLIGLRTRLLTATQGEAIVHHAFERYQPKAGAVQRRQQGVLIASESGKVTAYAIDNLADRGVMFVAPGEDVYAGQIIGEHNRDNDLTVNISRAKAHSNVRESNKEAFTKLKPPRDMPLEKCLEYIVEDELVEITPTAVRLRKRMLNESDRKKAARQAKDKVPAGA